MKLTNKNSERERVQLEERSGSTGTLRIQKIRRQSSEGAGGKRESERSARQLCQPAAVAVHESTVDSEDNLCWLRSGALKVHSECETFERATLLLVPVDRVGRCCTQKENAH